MKVRGRATSSSGLRSAATPQISSINAAAVIVAESTIKPIMAARLTCLALAFGAVIFSALAFGQGTGTGVLKLPQDIEFKGPLTGPPQTVVLYGDPTKPGIFVSRVKFSAGWKDPPHWHPDEVRTVVVLSGTLYFGSGDKWDESKFK